MFIRVEDQSGNPTVWLNINQIARLEESKSSDEVMGYTVVTVDNKEYYSPDVQVIQGMLCGAVVVDKLTEEQLRELERKLMMQDVIVRC